MTKFLGLGLSIWSFSVHSTPSHKQARRTLARGDCHAGTGERGVARDGPEDGGNFNFLYVDSPDDDSTKLSTLKKRNTTVALKKRI